MLLSLFWLSETKLLLKGEGSGPMYETVKFMQLFQDFDGDCGEYSLIPSELISIPVQALDRSLCPHKLCNFSV